MSAMDWNLNTTNVIGLSIFALELMFFAFTIRAAVQKQALIHRLIRRRNYGHHVKTIQMDNTPKTINTGRNTHIGQLYAFLRTWPRIAAIAKLTTIAKKHLTNFILFYTVVFRNIALKHTRTGASITLRDTRSKENQLCCCPVKMSPSKF